MKEINVTRSSLPSIEEYCEQIPDTKHRYDNSRLMPYFSELAEDLLSARP